MKYLAKVLIGALLAVAGILPAAAQAPPSWSPMNGTPTYNFGLQAPGTFAACLPIPTVATTLNARLTDAGITATYTFGIYTSASCTGSYTLCGSTVTVSSGGSATATCSLATAGAAYMEVQATGGSGHANGVVTALSSIASFNAWLLGGYPVNFQSPAAGQVPCFGGGQIVNCSPAWTQRFGFSYGPIPTPAAAGTYWMGADGASSVPVSGASPAAAWPAVAPAACTLRAVKYYTLRSGTADTGTNNVTLTVYDVTTSTNFTDTQATVAFNGSADPTIAPLTGLSSDAIAQSDQLEVKLAMPSSWTTQPTNVYFAAQTFCY